MEKRCRAWRCIRKFYETIPTFHYHRFGVGRRRGTGFDALAQRKRQRRRKRDLCPDDESAGAACHEQSFADWFNSGGDADETQLQGKFAGRARRVWRLPMPALRPTVSRIEENRSRIW